MFWSLSRRRSIPSDFRHCLRVCATQPQIPLIFGDGSISGTPFCPLRSFCSRSHHTSHSTPSFPLDLQHVAMRSMDDDESNQMLKVWPTYVQCHDIVESLHVATCRRLFSSNFCQGRSFHLAALIQRLNTAVVKCQVPGTATLQPHMYRALRCGARRYAHMCICDIHVAGHCDVPDV